MESDRPGGVPGPVDARRRVRRPEPCRLADPRRRRHRGIDYFSGTGRTRFGACASGERGAGMTNLRATLAADPELGAGNVVTRLLFHGADPDGPGIEFDTDVDGLGGKLTLGQLDERVN